MEQPKRDPAAERRHLQEALARERNMLRAIIDSIPDLVFVKDRDGRFVVANQAVAEAFGLQSPGQLIGKSDFDFLPADSIGHIVADEQAVIASGQSHISHEEPNSALQDGRWYSTTKVALRDGQGRIVGLVGACRDITEKKRHEADLERRNAELSALYAQLAQIQKQLVESEKLAALGALVAGIAHELNTPIGNCMLAAGAFADRTRSIAAAYPDGLKRSSLESYIADSGSACDVLMRNLRRAADLVISFKQITADQAGYQRGAFSLALLVSDVAGALLPALRANAVALSCDVAPEYRLDSFPGALQQVLLQLVDNAVLHAFEGRGGAISMVAGAAGEEGWLELSVSDDGGGIPAANLGRVFDPFFTTKMGVGGSGLGLSAAYNIVTGVLGGRIAVESRNGQGSRFTITLPIVAPAQ